MNNPEVKRNAITPIIARHTQATGSAMGLFFNPHATMKHKTNFKTPIA